MTQPTISKKTFESITSSVRAVAAAEELRVPFFSALAKESPHSRTRTVTPDAKHYIAVRVYEQDLTTITNNLIDGLLVVNEQLSIERAGQIRQSVLDEVRATMGADGRRPPAQIDAA